VWDVFRSSTEKLAACHLELVRKLQELIKEVQKYVDDQAKAHKKVPSRGTRERPLVCREPPTLFTERECFNEPVRGTAHASDATLYVRRHETEI
jgi:hypothetical protein